MTCSIMLASFSKVNDKLRFYQIKEMKRNKENWLFPKVVHMLACDVTYSKLVRTKVWGNFKVFIEPFRDVNNSPEAGKIPVCQLNFPG